MELNEEEDIKKEFQLERVILFTDAVFAIILTIMVLDIKLPEGVKKYDTQEIHLVFEELAPKFFAYFLTFGLVARFWIVHLKLFRYLKDYDSKLLILNLFFLFSVTLFPFGVSLISGKVDPKTHEFSLIWTAYVTIFFATVFMQSIISYYLLKKRETLCIDTPLLEENFKWKVARINLFLIPILVIAIFAFNYFQLPYYYPVYTVAAYGAVIARCSKIYYPENDKGPILMRLYRYIKPVKSKTPPRKKVAAKKH